MKLGMKQVLFGKDFQKLLAFVEEEGFDYVLGEVQRHIVTQKHYVQKGLSKTMNSQHIKKLAADIIIGELKDGGFYPIWDKEVLQRIGDYWESLSPENSWGGNWKSFRDTPHYERKG